MEIKKIIVVGGNAAGPAAAAKAKRVAPNADVIMFEAGDFISTGTCELPFLISKEIDDYKKIVFFDSKSFEEKKGVKVFTRHLVTKINRKEKNIEVFNSRDKENLIFNYDSLILTTGSKAKKIPPLATQFDNVFTLKSVSDYLDLSMFISNSSVKNVLVVGSGYIGLETADAFTKNGCEVTLVDILDLPLGGFDYEICTKLKSVIEEKIATHFSSNAKYVENGNRIEKVIIDNRIIDVDLVIQAVGVEPNNSLALTSGIELAENNAILVDNRMRTSDKHIFAAGDNVQLKNKLNRQNDYLPFATFARDMGHIAGTNAAGQPKNADMIIPNFAISVFGESIAAVGLSQKSAEKMSNSTLTVEASAYNKVHVMPTSRKVYGKLTFDKLTNKILGAAFIGGEEAAHYANTISALIQSNGDAKVLKNINFNYTPPLTPFTNLLNILGKKAAEQI